MGKIKNIPNNIYLQVDSDGDNSEIEFKGDMYKNILHLVKEKGLRINNIIKMINR